MLPDPSSFIHSLFLSFFQSGKNLYFHQIELFWLWFWCFLVVKPDKNPLWKSKHLENKTKQKKQKRKKKESVCWEGILPATQGIVTHTRTYSHTNQKGEKKRNKRRKKKQKEVLFDGQEGWHRLFLLIIAFRYSGYIFASSHDPLMLFPPKDSRHSPGIRETAFNTNKGFVPGVFKAEQRLRRSSFTASVWAFIFFKVGIPVGKGKIIIPLGYSLTSIALIGDWDPHGNINLWSFREQQHPSVYLNWRGSVSPNLTQSAAACCWDYPLLSSGEKELPNLDGSDLFSQGTCRGAFGGLLWSPALHLGLSGSPALPFCALRCAWLSPAYWCTAPS